MVCEGREREYGELKIEHLTHYETVLYTILGAQYIYRHTRMHTCRNVEGLVGSDGM